MLKPSIDKIILFLKMNYFTCERNVSKMLYKYQRHYIIINIEDSNNNAYREKSESFVYIQI